MGKIQSREELIEICRELKEQGETVGFTSGVFDLFHAGHAEYLRKAKSLCDVLVVGVNSDDSTRQLKGELRPIFIESDRLAVLAALASVDFVFEFNELNNNENIRLLEPDIYLKAGDYDLSRLTSAPIVESYGGRIEFVPFLKGRSTTSAVDLILDRYGATLAKDFGSISYPVSGAIFVDRDGTINYENAGGAPCEPEDFKIIPGVLEALREMRQLGYRIVVVTNQPGIGLGYYTKQDFFRVNRELLKAAGRVGLQIDRVYFCPHTKVDDCPCRKPEIGMLKRAEVDLNIDLSKSYMIGDMTGDIAAGQKAGCKTILVRTGKAGQDGLYQVQADFIVDDLKAAVEIVRPVNPDESEVT